MISIFLPSYNHSNFIIECIENLQKINLKIKIIIIDDSSIDNSVIKIKKYIYKNSIKNILLIEKETNKGVKHSLNLFLSLVDTEYVYLTASDDIVIAHGFEEVIKILEDNKEMKFIIGGGFNVFENSSMTNIYKKEHFTFFNLKINERYSAIFLNYPSPILSQSTIIRTSALRHIKVWDSEIMLDDFEMFIKLLIKFPEKKKDFEFKPDIPIVYYRHHKSNSYKDYVRQFFMTKQVLEKLAPVNLKEKAISKQLAVYFLKSIKSRQINTLNELIKLATSKQLIYSILHMIQIIYKKFFNARY